MRMMIAMLAGAGAVALSACAQSPDSITARPVSGVAYQGLDCAGLQREENRVVTTLNERVAGQRQARDNDNAIVGASVILLPIAGLAAMGGNDFADEIGQLRGEVQALDQAQAAAGCNAGV